VILLEYVKGDIMTIKIANVTLIRDEPATATIIAKQYIESIPFWKITWAPQHVIFHVDEADENELVVYRSDRIYELVTEDL
jgi:hypothetical protein